LHPHLQRMMFQEKGDKQQKLQAVQHA